MKKFIYSILFLLSAVMVSCDMDKMPSGTLTDTDAIQSMADAAKLRNYFNLRLRGINAGSPIYLMELPTDMFHPSIAYGNRGGVYYRWEWTSQDDFPESLWSYCYHSIATANYFLQEVAKFNTEELSQSELQTLEVYKGEAYFLKAFNMFILADRFCEVYDASKADTQMGVMIVDSYSPSSDPSTYPGRSSLKETYTNIETNLADAATALASVDGSVGSIYVTKDAVTALKARVALHKGDFDAAITAATSLITGGTYPLISADNAADLLAKFQKMWINDSGDECIMQLWADLASGSLPSSNSYSYAALNSSGIYTPDFIPETWVLDLFNDSDVRSSWFEAVKVTYGTIEGNVIIFNKFAGNPDLLASTAKAPTYINKIKPFRIAEQYLIAAEAYARKGGAANEAAARTYLNELKSKRDLEYMQNDNLSGDNLLKAIKDEHVRELMGEGFRMSDLKRWKQGFTRSAVQDTEVTTAMGSDMTIEGDDPRFLWPIPQAEIDSNPQIKNQQNPAYTK